MSFPLRLVLTLGAFVATLVLVLFGPRRVHEAWWTVGGALLVLGLRLVAPSAALDAIVDAKAALLFLIALLVLSHAVGQSGFFDWAAIRAAQLARGDGRVLYRNTFLLGALITVTFSLDTTAVILTPIVLALVKRLRLDALPYVALCAFVANIGSLALPISNLTNILLADAFHLTFVAFAARMALPQLVALVLTYAVLRFTFRSALASPFDAARLPPADSVVHGRRYFFASLAVLVLVLVGYFVAPVAHVEPFVVALLGGVALGGYGVATGRMRAASLAEISWGVVPFVVGLFVIIRAVADLGVARIAAAWLRAADTDGVGPMLGVAGVAALASNLMNNLPATILAKAALLDAGAHERAVLAALVGADAGPIVLPFASLATMLVLALARGNGVEVPAGRLLKVGAFLAPVVVVGAVVALAFAFGLSK